MSSYGIRLLIAFAGSIGIHLLVLEVWFVMSTLNVITGRAPKRPEIQPPEVPVLALVEPREQPKPKTFVETDSLVESPVDPKESDFYSDRSSKAANPNPDLAKLGDKPMLEGKQDKVHSTANVPLPQPFVGEVPEAKPEPKPQKELHAEPAAKPQREEPKIGPDKTELAMLTEGMAPKQQAPQPRPAKQEARLAPPPSERIIPEAESKTRTSASREGIKAFDVTGTKFGEYDRRLIAAVKSRWLALIEQYTIPGERSGQVQLRFHLNQDGSVTELIVADNTAGDILALYCQKAVTDSAPFGPWPEELKALVKRNYRELNFVFYY